MGRRAIRVECEGAKTIPLQELKELQGELKSLSAENYGKLKKQILDLGFSEPVSVWQNEGVNYLLNGTQRTRTLRTMAVEGYEIPAIPVSIVSAKSLKEAKKKILSLTSQYGVIEGQGLYEFMDESQLVMEDIEDFRFAEVDIGKFQAEYFGEPEPDPEPEDSAKAEKQCPHCGLNI